MNLVGRRALVTGATRGIGRGVAEALAAAGASLALTGREQADGERVARTLSAAHGIEASFAPADLADAEAAAGVVEGAVAQLGGLDILCHCAGIYPSAPLESMAPEKWQSVLDTNLGSSLALIAAAIPPLRASRHGRVVLVTSITGPRTAIPGLAHYAASKAGQEGLARAAALELAPYSITVNCIAPGTIHTEGLAALYTEPGALEASATAIPLGRAGTPAEVGALAAFLVSDEAAYITGQTIVIDGGRSIVEH